MKYFFRLSLILLGSIFASRGSSQQFTMMVGETDLVVTDTIFAGETATWDVYLKNPLTVAATGFQTSWSTDGETTFEDPVSYFNTGSKVQPGQTVKVATIKWHPSESVSSSQYMTYRIEFSSPMTAAEIRINANSVVRPNCLFFDEEEMTLAGPFAKGVAKNFSIPLRNIAMTATPVTVLEIQGEGLEWQTSNPLPLTIAPEGQTELKLKFTPTDEKEHLMFVRAESACGTNAVLITANVVFGSAGVSIDGATRTTVSVTPNPATDVIHVNASGFRRAEFELIDSRGVVRMRRAGSDAWDLRVSETDATELPSGTYTIRASGVDLEGRQQAASTRVVVVR